MRIVLLNLMSFIFASSLFAQPLFSVDSFNGFDISKSLIPKDEILSGGPPRDGIPAILEPKFESAGRATWLNDGDLVTGVIINGVQKAYPLRILVWHEAVNDEIGGMPILISYCPLCGSTLVFSRELSGEQLTFGISGLLYQSDVLFYDHQNESLWSQLEMKAVTGKKIGTELELIPSTLATWKKWKAQHPKTLVLSRNTGFSRSYSRDPYTGYEKSELLMFPVKNKSDRFHPKEKVLVVMVGHIAKAYPFSELDKVGKPFEDKIGEQEVLIKYGDGNYVTATDKSGKPIKSFVAYWSAWYTFRPDTQVFNARPPS
ncbi:MAG: DUF3179 domain-containing protein [Thermodesulfobacteriota bacterium]